MSAIRLTFYGGAETVTGSNFLVEADGKRILVDCGIEQGRDFSAKEMYGPFPYDAKSIDALIITHAHLDHVGRMPKLVKDGFRGRVYMTPPTRDLAELILRDSAHILAEEAEQRGLPVLYSEADVSTLFTLVETVPYRQETQLGPGLSFLLRNTGHILGSASVRIKASDGTAVALTGDIGNSPSPLLPDWEPVTDADAIVMESVYGDRVHPDRGTRVAVLRDQLKKAIAKGGAILIPAFSLERTQLMLRALEFLRFGRAAERPRISRLASGHPRDGGIREMGRDIFQAGGRRGNEAREEPFRFPIPHQDARAARIR